MVLTLVEPLRRILIATLVSIGGFVLLLAACFAVDAVGGTLETLGGDKWGILIPFCIGLPLGSVLGIAIAERRRKGQVGPLGLGIAFTTTLGGVYIAATAMDLFGFNAILLAPFITSTAGYAGFGIVSRISAYRGHANGR